MKQSLLLFSGLFASSLSVFAQQTPVSQTAQNKNVILEELTGIYCQYCPSGHEIANGIAAANPGRVVLVNIHAGGFAAPNAGAPDFRTQDGNALNSFLNPGGSYPVGAVNRIPSSASPTEISASRSDWSNMATSVLGQAAPVNIAMNASIDAATRIVTVNVEMFYTTTQQAGTIHKLNVGILQDDVEGPQTNSGGWNAQAILPNGKYNHEHIFRGFINAGGTWGEAIDATQTGVITKTITYTLPASVANVPLNIGKLQFFAFLHKGNNTATTSEVLNTAKVTPAIVNVPVATGSANSIVNSFVVCDGESITPIVRVDNSGAEITSLNFSTTVNGGTAVPFAWTGTIPQFGSADITLPAMVVNAIATNSTQVVITSVNGGQGVVGSTSSATKPITIAPIANGSTATVKVSTDAFGSELTWNIKNSSGTVVASGGPYSDHGSGNQPTPGAYAEPDVSFSLAPNECYTITLEDEYGDGFDSGYGNGSFRVQVNGANLVTAPNWNTAQLVMKMASSATASIAEASSEIGMAVYPNPASGLVNVSFDANGGDYSVAILDISGRTVATKVVTGATGAMNVEMSIADLQAGNYFVKVSQGAAAYTQKLMVK